MLFTRPSPHSWLSKHVALGYPHVLVHKSYFSSRSEATSVSGHWPSTATPGNVEEKSQGSFFLDSIFPLRLGAWDLRHYIAPFFQEQILIDKLQGIFEGVDIHGFTIHNIEPRIKDGGVFVNFEYTPLEQFESINASLSSPNPALVEIEDAIKERINRKGGLPSWIELERGRLWRVIGHPWREDMRRYVSPILRVSFEGPDVSEERLWEILRPYGRIRDIKPPTTVPSGTLRSITVIFERTVSAAIAHNCIHGAYVPLSPKNPEALTRLMTSYERPIKPHLVRDWLASHPKIVFPVVVFLIGTLTYTVFDPIRAVAVQAKVMGWLDYRKFALTKWLRRNALDRLTTSYETAHSEAPRLIDTTVWKDREEAESTLDSYLLDYPSTIAFVHGPAGSGKSKLIRSVLEKSDRRALVIDCADIYSGSSDSIMVATLAEQTGYWPMFRFLNSINNLIDLASVGLIGQKAGLSSSLEEQVTQVLDVVANGLKRVSASSHKEAEKRIQQARDDEWKLRADAKRREHIRRGVWHDGRLDCIAGNGIMSELGVGIERFGEDDEVEAHQGCDEDTKMLGKSDLNDRVRGEREYKAAQDVGALPVVVIKNFASNAKSGKAEIATALSEWAADLVTGHIAHVIVVSDNRENAKRLAKVLPSKPLSSVALSDADPASSLSYIVKKLEEVSIEYNISPEETQLIERLGGRASDLETLIHKVRAGQNITEAVEELIQRGVAELRKNAFGDDSEDAKGLPWSREQAWTVLKLLARNDELPYHQVLLDFPFKGDESALKAMEHSELISITTVNGRPATVRPGKPIHRYVFQRLLNDRVFRATQDIAFNEQLISSALACIKSTESELAALKDIVNTSWKISNNTGPLNRARYLMEKMQDASAKVSSLEKENVRLKKVLSYGEEQPSGEKPENRSKWNLW